ncbi:MAG: hypothetical protein J6X94_07495 [Lachnospiraceae bacterium]|nr:hypothetical protein [Lachnospiraceae bacterium]
MFKKILMYSVISLSVISMNIMVPFFVSKANEAVAEEAVTVTVEEPEVVAEEIPVYDPTQPVDIVINLEDETRYMGVTVYRIGDYDGERFTYIPEVLSLVGKDYYKLSRGADIKAHAATIASQIQGTNLEGQNVSVVSGVGTIEDLTGGLYLIVQNKADHNASIDVPYIVETPQWSEETMEYMYDVRFFPKWEREVWFTFRHEVIYPFVMGALLIFLVIYSLMGGRILKAVLSVLAFFACGYVGMIESCEYFGIESDFLWMFVFFMIFAFVGIGVLWIIVAVISAIFRKIHGTELIRKNLFWITAFSGSAGVFFLLSRYILTDRYICGVIAVIIGTVGCMVQFFGRKKQACEYTYEDLYRIKVKEVSDDERADS